MFKDEYLSKWNKLTQEWIKVIYNNANKNIQLHIEKFIDPSRIEDIGYFEYYDIRHRDPRFKHLGEFINEFDKNIIIQENKSKVLVQKEREKNKDTKSIVLPVGMKAEEVAAMGIPEEGMDEIIDLSGEGNDIE
jgi:hypothetical protein